MSGWKRAMRWVVLAAGLVAPGVASATGDLDAAFFANLRFHARPAVPLTRISHAATASGYRETWLARSGPGRAARVEVDVRWFATIADASASFDALRRRGERQGVRWAAYTPPGASEEEMVEDGLQAPGELLWVRDRLLVHLQAEPRAAGSAYLRSVARDVARRILWQRYATTAARRDRVDRAALPAGFVQVDQWAHLGSEAGRPRVLTARWSRGRSEIELRIEYFAFADQMLERTAELFPGLARLSQAPADLHEGLFRRGGAGDGPRYVAFQPSGLKLAQVRFRGPIAAGDTDRPALALVRSLGWGTRDVRPVPRAYLAAEAAPGTLASPARPPSIPSLRPPETRSSRGAVPATAVLEFGAILAVAGTGAAVWRRHRRRASRTAR